MKKLRSIFTAVAIILLLQNISFAQQNLVTNGDFSGGNTGFTSLYAYCNTAGCMGACGCPPQYAVGNNANYYHGALIGFDHTTGTGNFLIADGGVSAVSVWKQTIPVTPNNDYIFSYWLSSLYPTSPASIQVAINGVNIGTPLTAPGTLNTWIPGSMSWNSGSNTSAIIDIVDLNTTFVGNDFGLDDISFTQNCNSANSFICDVVPGINAINVNKSSDISITFSQAMNASTINSSNIKVFGSQTGLLSYLVSYNAGTKTAAINPNSDFKVGEKILVTLSSGIQTSTNSPITPFTWTFIVQALSGTGIFTESSIVDTSLFGGGLYRIVSGDFDSDGDLELAVSGPDNIIIYKNNGTAEFSYSQTISGFGGNILTGDFDGDLDLDIVSGLILFKNDGNGMFTYASSSPGGGGLGDAGDLDEDGDLDIAYYSGSEIRWYLNDGNGNFIERLISFDDLSGLPPFVLNLSLGDMDNDGDLDFNAVVIQIHSPQYTDLLTLYNDGNANFGNAARLSTYFYNTISADLDGDYDLDILSNINLFFNNGNGTFTSAPFSSGTNSYILPADYDADGDIDAVFTNESSNNVKVFKNNSTGTLLFSWNSTSGTSPNYGTSGDLDGDGDIDLAVLNNLGHSGSYSDISILKNNPECTPPPCSITGSDIILPGSANNIYVGSTPTGFWDISNYGNTQASIPPNSTGYTVKVSAGANTGHFVLYFITPDGCGGYPFCFKHVYVVDEIVINCNITAVTEGFYNLDLNKLNMRDTVKAYLRNTTLPYDVVDSSYAIIDSSNFTGEFTFSNASTGTYYIVLKHRNGLETWSKDGGESFVSGASSSYDFTSSQSQAYGNNLILKGTKYCIYSGDVNQDRVIDAADLSLVDNDAFNYATGYISTDITGNRTVDVADLAIVDNNAFNYVTAKRPAGSDLPELGANKSSRSSKLSNSSKSGEPEIEIPKNFELKDSYPNPFNPTTKINYELPLPNYVTLKIYDIAGKEVATLVNTKQNAGRYTVEFNGSNLSSGTYFYKIVAGEFTQVKRMILVK